MRWLDRGPALSGAIGLVLLMGCGAPDSVPHPGDTVTPQLDSLIGEPIEWRAGTSPILGVRLVAKGPDDKRPRVLTFQAIPWGVNPVAVIRFFRGEDELGSREVPFTHRC